MTSSLHTYDLRQAYTASNENCLKKKLQKAKEGEVSLSLYEFWCVPV